MQFLARYLQKLPGQTRAVCETCLFGLAAGAATVAFQLGMNWLYRLGLVQLSHKSMTTFLIGSFAVIVSSSLLVGWLLNSFCREAAGSGIPQLKLAFWKEFGTVPWRVAWVKFVAGILTRKEAEAALTEGRLPRLEAATTCLPGQTIRQLQALLIESSTHLVALTDADGQTVLAVVTLHDLLRAEVEKARSSEE
jgi:CIC family chloride channel protein